MIANPPRVFLAALSLAGAGAVLLATLRYGAGLSPDAVGYIGVARQLLAGNGVSGYEGQPFVIQPPLYPVLLALAGWLAGADPLHLAPLLNALLCGVAVFLTAQLCARHRQLYPSLASFGPALSLLSWPFFAVGVMAWSEPLFITLGLAALLSLGRYLDEERLGWLVAAGVAVALACLTRYIGLAFLLAGGVLVCWRSARPLAQRLAHLVCFGAIAGLPLVGWLARNHQLTGTWLGPRQASAHTLAENLGLTCAGLAGLWVPEVLGIPRLLRLGLAGAVALALLAAALWLARRWRTTGAGLALVAGWGGAYVLFLIFTSTTTAYDDINLRLLSPFYPCGAVLVLALAGRVEQGGWPRAARAGLVVLLALSLAGIAVAGAGYLDQGAGAGTGPDRYNTAPWRQSETIQYLRQHPAPGALYSNAPDALYILGGLSATLSPRRAGEAAWPPAGRLVWLDAVRRQYLRDPAELRARHRVRLLARFADGALYEFLPVEKE
ncbi:MAG: glycosyltransferase family 39 protein [Candidatus Latescibacteria bacterium]|nr:glycosyltransferase family 39 protein [Candidatus Latescibacterota bacterium]